MGPAVELEAACGASRGSADIAHGMVARGGSKGSVARFSDLKALSCPECSCTHQRPKKLSKARSLPRWQFKYRTLAEVRP